MSLVLGMFFIVAGAFFYGVRKFGFFQRRGFYRLVPNFLIANGIGFFIPLHAYQDGRILAVLFFIGDELWFYRGQIMTFWQRLRDDWDKLQGM